MSPEVIDVEVEERVEEQEAFRALVGRLSRQSVDKHYDAYADIGWDNPEMAIDACDPRWILPTVDPLGATDWYRSQPIDVRARIGLWRIATMMKTGQQFENILKRGLLGFAYKLPNGSPEFRYAYHETIEEAHHGLMFQEFVNRTGLAIRGLPPLLRASANLVVLLGRIFPELFFFFVLGGEDPIDHTQREMLRRGEPLHPLLDTIVRHHITEEARHLSFARHYLKLHVPQLGRIRRLVLSFAIPGILGVMAAIMLGPSPAMLREFGIPREVVAQAYGRNPAASVELRSSLTKVRNLAMQLGLVTPATRVAWKALHIWES